MIPKSLLLALLLFPASLLAENVLEMRYVIPKEQPGAVKAPWAQVVLLLSPDIVINQRHVRTAEAIADKDNQGFWLVEMKLTADGTKRFDEEAAKHQGGQLAILVHGKVVSAPIIRASKFGGTLQLAGWYMGEEAAKELAAALAAGLKK